MERCRGLRGIDSSWGMQDYTRLLVWQRSRSLTVAVHEVARGISPQAAPGLRAQLLRAAMSISTNIAEGAGRDSRVDFARFLTIAIGSTSEVQHHLLVCGDLELVHHTVADRLLGQAVEVRRMLFGLRRALLARDAEVRATEREAPPVDPEASN